MSDASQGGEPIKKEDNPPSIKSETGEQNPNHPNPSSPSRTDTNPRPPTTNRTYTDEENPFKKLNLHVKEWKETYEFLGILAGLAVLIVLVCQYEEMRQTRILDERAWVAVREIVIPPQSGIFPNTIFKAVFKNTGKTPAINVSAWMNQSSSTNSIPEKDQPMNPTNTLVVPQFSGLLAPDSEGSISVSSWLLDFDTTQAIKNDTKPYYVYCTIRYDDIFGNHHWSQFCYQIRPLYDPIESLPVT